MPQAYVVKSTSKILTKYIRHTSNALYGFFFINKCTLLTYGFVPDIMIILQKYKLVEYIDNFFSKTSLFPSKKYMIRMLQ
jgi:hypothetical protein